MAISPNRVTCIFHFHPIGCLVQCTENRRTSLKTQEMKCDNNEGICALNYYANQGIADWGARIEHERSPPPF